MDSQVLNVCITAVICNLKLLVSEPKKEVYHFLNERLKRNVTKLVTLCCVPVLLLVFVKIIPGLLVRTVKNTVFTQSNLSFIDTMTVQIIGNQVIIFNL